MDEASAKPARKHLNLVQKRALKAAAVQRFATAYGRKAQKGVEPNDRRVDRSVARKVDAMRPEDFDRLVRDDED